MPFPRRRQPDAPPRHWRDGRARCLSSTKPALAVALAALVLAIPLITHATNTVALFMSPSGGQVFAGTGSLVIAQEVAPVGDPGLGSFDLELTYNANVLMLSVREGPFLASSGNATSCVNTYLAPGDIRFACHANGVPAHGPQGRGVLAYYDVTPRFSADSRPTDHNGVLSVLHDVVTKSSLMDVHGDPIPVASVGDAVIVARQLEGDLNSDCIVNVEDDQMIASRYPAVFGLLSYSPHFDLEPTSGDEDIDIKDLQFVFGRNGSTCGIPIPPQMPPPGTTPTIPPTATRTPAPPTVTASPTSITNGTNTPTGGTATPSSATPTGNATTTVVQTPTPTAVETATPVPTESAVPTGTPTRVSTVLAGTPTTEAKTPPAGLPPTGFDGRTRGYRSPLGWLLTALAATAIGIVLMWRASHRRTQ